MTIRNKLFDYGFIKIHEVTKPVISVGNITTGGTGKTPFVIYLAEYFLEKGKNVGIVSRGYRRENRDIVLVSDGNTINDSPDQSGDELIMIAEELIRSHKNNFFIAAGNNRVKAAEYLINKFNPDVIILDDAFQHRRIKRDLDIILIDAADHVKNRFVNYFTLPSGNLRERFSGISRADIIIQNNKSDDIPVIPELMISGKDIPEMRYKSEYFMDSKNRMFTDIKEDAVVFSGIANDMSFLNLLKKKELKVTDVIKFRDHHNYIQSDIDMLINKFSSNIIFITTEKDFVKVRKFKDFIFNYPVFFLKIRPEINANEGILISKLDKLVK